MTGLYEVNGTKVFVDDRGPETGPPLLYIHGGPGQSCWDFMASVADRIADAGIRVIGVDQRGILRSDPLPGEPALSVDLLIADFEALREQLGLDQWVVLGHSFGGGYALDYAIRHPASVSGVIFDCPSFDGDATDRFRLPRAAALLDELGKPDAAAACRTLTEKPDRITVEDQSWKLLDPLGADRMQLFLHDGHSWQKFVDLMDTAPPDFDWTKGVSHAPLIADMYRSRVGDLAALGGRSMLIHGIDDLVIPPGIIRAYQDATGGEVHTLDRSGHFGFIEQPDEYAREVAGFVLRS